MSRVTYNFLCFAFFVLTVDVGVGRAEELNADLYKLDSLSVPQELPQL